MIGAGFCTIVHLIAKRVANIQLYYEICIILAKNMA